MTTVRIARRTILAALVAMCVALAAGGCASHVSSPYGDYIPAGEASWYGPGFGGKPTANGEMFDPTAMTAAHKTLRFGTRVRVTNIENGRSVIVRINDRFPNTRGRIIDLSQSAFEQIAPLSRGVVPVRVDVMETTP